MNSVALLLCLFQAPMDPVRAQGQLLPLHLVERTSPQTAQNPGLVNPYVEKVRQIRFEQRLAQLARAVEQFSNEYSQNRGQVWPAAKAKALREAMAELQRIDPSFSPKAH